MNLFWCVSVSLIQWTPTSTCSIITRWTGNYNKIWWKIFRDFATFVVSIWALHVPFSLSEQIAGSHRTLDFLSKTPNTKKGSHRNKCSTKITSLRKKSGSHCKAHPMRHVLFESKFIEEHQSQNHTYAPSLECMIAPAMHYWKKHICSLCLDYGKSRRGHQCTVWVQIYRRTPELLISRLFYLDYTNLMSNHTRHLWQNYCNQWLSFGTIHTESNEMLSTRYGTTSPNSFRLLLVKVQTMPNGIDLKQRDHKLCQGRHQSCVIYFRNMSGLPQLPGGVAKH